MKFTKKSLDEILKRFRPETGNTPAPAADTPDLTRRMVLKASALAPAAALDPATAAKIVATGITNPRTLTTVFKIAERMNGYKKFFDGLRDNLGLNPEYGNLSEQIDRRLAQITTHKDAEDFALRLSNTFRSGETNDAELSILTPQNIRHANLISEIGLTEEQIGTIAGWGRLFGGMGFKSIKDASYFIHQKRFETVQAIIGRPDLWPELGSLERKIFLSVLPTFNNEKERDLRERIFEHKLKADEAWWAVDQQVRGCKQNQQRQRRFSTEKDGLRPSSNQAEYRVRKVEKPHDGKYYFEIDASNSRYYLARIDFHYLTLALALDSGRSEYWLAKPCEIEVSKTPDYNGERTYAVTTKNGLLAGYLSELCEKPDYGVIPFPQRNRLPVPFQTRPPQA